MRLGLVLVLVVGCASHARPPYRVSMAEKYEVGEDATVELTVQKLSDDDAQLIITRPDGSIVKQHAPLDVASSRVPFGRPPPHPGVPPTFTIEGTYQVELHVDDKVLAKDELTVSRNRIDELLPIGDVADYTQVTRYTRPKHSGKRHWKTYGAIYVLARNVDARIEVTIEEPGAKNLREAWKPYEEDGAISVMENNNVVFRERTGSVSASWISGDRIVGMKAPTLADLEKGLTRHFLTRFPSKLDAK